MTHNTSPTSRCCRGSPIARHTTVPVKIQADKSRRHRYSFGAGYATDTGVRGTLTWENRHVNTLGHRFSLTIQASQVTRYYSRPLHHPDRRPGASRTLTFNASIEQQTLRTSRATTQSIGPSITKVEGSWQYVWFVNAMRTTERSVADGSTTDGCWSRD